tara:strand:+ start:18081 stop:18854 length:774 start_codon:yes stop_codon:yes gene_type:complete
MKNLVPVLCLSLGLISCQANPKKRKNIEPQKIQTVKVTKEWTSLFDGKTLNSWHQYNGEGVGKQWTVEESTMVFNPEENRNYGEGGRNIVTDKEYTNFVLSIEWKISEGGNSGIFWGIRESKEFGEPYLTGPEIQILDNDRHPDALENPKYHQTGALYDMVQPTSDVCNPAGEWNHIVLTINHNTNKGSVVLNEIEIVAFALHGPEWDSLVKASKFGNKKASNYLEAPKFGTFRTGKIGLQDHGDQVYFRNIKIKEL